MSFISNLSLSVASTLYDWANVAFVFSLILGVVATFVLIRTGAIKEKYLNRDLQDSRERTALLEKQYGESQLAIAEAGRRGDEAKAEAAVANRAIAEANKVAEHERLERMKLEASIAPRRITAEQQKAIALSLHNFAGKNVHVTSYTLDMDGALIGRQIAGLLRAAGINVVLDSRTPMGGGFASGILVNGQDGALVDAIVKGLSTADNLDAEKWAGPPPTFFETVEPANMPKYSFDATITVGVKRIKP